MLQRLEYIQPEITKLNYVVEVPTHLQESYTRQRHVQQFSVPFEHLHVAECVLHTVLVCLVDRTSKYM